MADPEGISQPVFTDGQTQTDDTCDKLWFDDGNIVLQAENTRFKVHRGILALHSTVFANMFADAQPTSESDFEGCPFIYLSDPAPEVEVMLLEIFARGKYWDLSKKWTFERLKAFLRMGTKYEIDHMRLAAIHCLEQDFPSTFDAMKAEFAARGHVFMCKNIEDYIGLELDLLCLAQEYNITSVLPMLFFVLHDWALVQLVDGLKRDNDVGGRAVLTTDLISTLLQGREQLSRQQASMIKRWINTSSDDCTSPVECKTAKSLFLGSLYVPSYVCIALIPWSNDNELVDLYDAPYDWDENICKVCTKEAKQAHESRRREVWDQLPTYFKLPSWDTLLSR